MWTIVIAMLVILALAALVMVYVAYPHRGQQVPKAAWLGDAMGKAVDRAPVMKDGELEDDILLRK